MINQVTLVGRLGKEPEIEEKGQHKLMKLSIATDDSYKDKDGAWQNGTDDSYKDKDGAWQNGTDWHNLTLWNRQAEYVKKFAFKGAIVLVQGMMKTRKWTDKDGHDRYDYHIEPKTIKVLNAKKVEGGSGQPPASSGGSRSSAEDDLPF